MRAKRSGEKHKPHELDSTKPKLVVVEGPDDEQITAEALVICGLVDVQVVNCGGKPNIRPDLVSWSEAGALRHVSSLVILRDADDDSRASLLSVHDALRAAGLPVPHAEFEFAGVGPRVAVALVGVRQPDGGELFAGRMEELFLHCMVAEEPHLTILKCADSGLKCASDGYTGYHDPAKARVSAFLSLHPDLTGKPFGTTGPKGLWNWSHPALKPYLDLLRAM